MFGHLAFDCERLLNYLSFIDCKNFLILQNHPTFHPEERLVSLVRGRECYNLYYFCMVVWYRWPARATGCPRRMCCLSPTAPWPPSPPSSACPPTSGSASCPRPGTRPHSATTHSSSNRWPASSWFHIIYYIFWFDQGTCEVKHCFLFFFPIGQVACYVKHFYLFFIPIGQVACFVKYFVMFFIPIAIGQVSCYVKYFVMFFIPIGQVVSHWIFSCCHVVPIGQVVNHVKTLLLFNHLLVRWRATRWRHCYLISNWSVGESREGGVAI